MKRHSWKINSKEQYVKRKYESKLPTKVYKVHDVKECANCGLRRGVSNRNKWSSYIYFNQENEWLSEKKVPYPCKEINTDFFFKENEFFI